MSMLQFITRGHSSPRGKEKVFFTAHPDDYAVFLASVSEDILNLQNCVICYRDQDGEFDAAELDEMSLVVIPVTAKLLYTANTAKDLDFPCARKKGIPILPILEDARLGEAFNRIMGELHYLSPTERDSTAIDYPTKLKSFLDTVMVRDELAAAVHAAFRDRIFLSYRKKDRASVKPIMQKLHETEAFWDIAIWYDEFLQPGENFNESIKTALHESAVFVMVLTPNLVGEDNYVQKEEYPYAKAHGMAILPIEVLPTDRTLLAARFPDLPNIYAFDAPWPLEKMLSRCLDVRELTAERLFYLGLAYLSGIEVEINRPRALRLLTESAEQGYQAAMERLVSVYLALSQTEKAILWQERLAEAAKSVLDKEHGQAELDKATEAYLALSRLKKRYQSAEAARSALQAFYDYVQTLDSPSDRRLQEARLALALGELWSIGKNPRYHSITGFFDPQRYNTEKAFFFKALSLFEALTKESDGRYDVELSTAYAHIGRFYERNGAAKEAEHYFEASLALERTLYRNDPANAPQLAKVLAYIGQYLMNQALIRSEKQTPEEKRSVTDTAKGYYAEALTLRRERFEEARSRDTADKLIDCLFQFGELCEFRLEYDEAERYFRETVELSLQVAENAGTFDDQLFALDLLYLCGAFCKRVGAFDKAKRYLADALTRTETLQSYLTEIAYTERTIKLYATLGDIAALEDDPYAETAYRAVLDDAERQFDTYRTVDLLSELANARFYYGLYRRSPEILTEAADGWRELYQTTEIVSMGLLSLVAEQFAEVFSTMTPKGKLTCFSMSEGNAAFSDKRAAYGLITFLILENTPEAQKQLASFYVKTGLFYEKRGMRIPSAQEAFQKALPLCENLVATHPEERIFDALATSLYYLGLYEKAPDPIRRAYTVWNDLACQTLNAGEYLKKRAMASEALQKLAAEKEIAPKGEHTGKHRLRGFFAWLNRLKKRKKS